MGGYIAFEIMRQAPERVAKLALLDTGARPELPEQTARRRPLMELARSGRFAQIPDFSSRSSCTKIVMAMSHCGTSCAPWRRKPGRTRFCASSRRSSHGRIRVRASAPLPVPTLVLVGEGDELTPPVLSQEIAAALPGARLVVVPDCGHLSTLERPQAVTQALVEWMEP